ncbi:hypothetical protein M8J75_000064 [Diaphorina citri]|nr:hypothetical protein M8J75_000064 [Diaphorina citri]
MTRARAEVIDITIASPTLSSQIERWHVSDEPSHSDHRYIRFEVSGVDKPDVTYRNPRKTKWRSYRQCLESELRLMRTDIKDTGDIEEVSNNLSIAINKAYEACCPEVKVLNKNTSWWTQELSKLRKHTRRLFNRAKVNNDWESYHQSLREYNKAIRTAKRAGWRNLCHEIGKTSEAARLLKIMAKEPVTLGTIKKPNGEWTQTGKETLETLIETHFPGSESFDYANPSDTARPGTPLRKPQKDDWELAKNVVTHKKRTFGKSWGLKPRVMNYLYREVIRPTVTYCAVVWWPKTDQRQAKELLDKIQRLGCLCITSAMSSTPTLAMETLLGLTPLDIHVKGTARTVAHRLKLNNTWITQHHGHSIITTAISDPLFEMRSDMMAVEENFDNPVNVVIETAGNWGGQSNSETKTFIKSWAQKAHQDRWDKVSGLRHSKLMMLGPNKDLTMNILSLNRKNIRLVTSLITGHCGLRKHLQTMGLYQGQVVCSSQEITEVSKVKRGFSAHSGLQLGRVVGSPG